MPRTIEQCENFALILYIRSLRAGTIEADTVGKIYIEAEGLIGVISFWVDAQYRPHLGQQVTLCVGMPPELHAGKTS